MPTDLGPDVDRAFVSFSNEIERLAQLAAGTEAVLYATDKDDEWKKNAAFEYELSSEVEYLQRAKRLIEQRMAARQRLLDRQIARREAD